MYGNYAAKKLEINCSQVFNFVLGNTVYKYFIYKIYQLFSTTAMKRSCRSHYITIRRHGSLGKIFINNILNYKRRLFEQVKIMKLKGWHQVLYGYFFSSLLSVVMLHCEATVNLASGGELNQVQKAAAGGLCSPCLLAWRPLQRCWMLPFLPNSKSALCIWPKVWIDLWRGLTEYLTIPEAVKEIAGDRGNMMEGYKKWMMWKDD